MSKEYTETEKTTILRELGITLVNGMLLSSHVAKIWTRRTEIEFGRRHDYKSNSVRWRSKAYACKTPLKVIDTIEGDLLFAVDDAFAIKLTPGKGGPKSTKKAVEVPV